jgi:hypothetical protein
MFSEFELKNFEKRIRKFLYKDKNKKTGYKRNTWGGKRKIHPKMPYIYGLVWMKL